MSTYHRRTRSAVASAAPVELPHLTSAVLLAVAALSLVWLLHFAGHPLVLPLISLGALASAAVVAFAAWRRTADQTAPAISLWDVSGACAFVGFAAGMLSDPQQLVEFWFASAEVGGSPR